MERRKYVHSTSIIVAALLAFVIGISLSVYLRPIKYTEFIQPGIVDIDPTVAYENIRSNPDGVIFIDVRSEYEYSQAHASSSINLPIHYMYDDTHGLQNEKGIPLPRNTEQEIYLICTGGRLAGVAYSYLEHYGYRNIKRIKGGIKNWNMEGLPVVTKSLFGTSYEEGSYRSNTGPLDKSYVSTPIK